MQPKGWKNFLFAILLTTNGALQVFAKVDKAWAKDSYVERPRLFRPPEIETSEVTFLTNEKISDEQCQQFQNYTSSQQVTALQTAELAKIDDSQELVKEHHQKSPTQEINNEEFIDEERCFHTSLSTNKFLQLSSNSELEVPQVGRDCQGYICQQSFGFKGLHSQVLPDSTQPQPSITEGNSQPNPTGNTNTRDLQVQNDPPPLEVAPGAVPNPGSEKREQLLQTPQLDYSQRLETLIQILQPQTQSLPTTSNLELGLRVRPRKLAQPPLEQQPLPTIEQPVPQFKPIGLLQARVGYFNSSNIFSTSVDPVNDSLIFYGLTLASAYIPLNSRTYITGSIDGNKIHYLDQSIYDYNQLRFNVSLYRQLSQRMYGEFSLSNQLLFYANNSDTFQAGDRFLNENTIRFSLGRRDQLNTNLTLDSFYELSASFSDPDTRSRITNSFWLSLSYYLQRPLQVGINYQFNLSNFTNRPDSREDEFHRLFGHLTYRVSTYSNVNLQGGVTFGGSSAPSIDFDGWFFSLNYSWDLGQF